MYHFVNAEQMFYNESVTKITTFVQARDSWKHPTTRTTWHSTRKILPINKHTFKINNWCFWKDTIQTGWMESLNLSNNHRINLIFEHLYPLFEKEIKFLQQDVKNDILDGQFLQDLLKFPPWNLRLSLKYVPISWIWLFDINRDNCTIFPSRLKDSRSEIKNIVS